MVHVIIFAYLNDFVLRILALLCHASTISQEREKSMLLCKINSQYLNSVVRICYFMSSVSVSN